MLSTVLVVPKPVPDAVIVAAAIAVPTDTGATGRNSYVQHSGGCLIGQRVCNRHNR